MRDKPLFLDVQRFSCVLRVPFDGLPTKRRDVTLSACYAKSNERPSADGYVLVSEPLVRCNDDHFGPARVHWQRS